MANWTKLKCACMAVVAAGATQGQAPYPLKDAVECTVRGGLPNLAAKLAAGADLKIGYLGGSITAQPGWRPQTLAWFAASYPQAKLSEINAAIGGTGSDLGVFRLNQDVLQHKPDLLFVEFAVNDGGAQPEHIIRAMEGIVRQTWRADPTTDICFVYTLTQGMVKDLQDGKMPRAASVMEDVADAYGIPSIHMGLRVAQMEAEKKVIFQDMEDQSAEVRKTAMEAGVYHFSRDGVHPYTDTGHILYLQAVERAMKQILPAAKPGPHTLATPLRADNWEDAKMVPLSKAQLSPEWQRCDPATDGNARAFANRLPELWLTNTPGASVHFRFKGTVVKIYDLLGPQCGAVRVTVDGKDVGTRDRFDPYCTYYRLATLGVAEGLAADEIHEVRLEVAAEQPKKRDILKHRAGPNADVLALDDQAFATRFDGTKWYAGTIMLLGELVD